MPDEIDRQAIIDEEHLKLISLGYMISAGVAAFFSLLGLFYVAMGAVMGYAIAHSPSSSPNGQPPPAFVGLIFAGIGLVIFLFAIGMGIARFWAGRCVKQRKSRTFCMVIAAFGCLEFPYGTTIGVLTLIVLGRPSVMKLFGRKPAA